jgi:hypothetical protein
MAYPTGYVGTSLASTASRTRSTSGFIPELWGDEVIATYEKNLVLANLLKRIPFAGKKGDTIHIPNFTRGSASAKAAGTAVTLVGTQAEETPILIDKHYEYSVLIEDIAALQAMDQLRSMYTSDAGYALAKQVEENLWMKFHYLQGGAATPAAATLFETAVIGGDGVTTFSGASGGGNGSVLTDAGIRRMIQTLDDRDVPMDGRALIIPPVERKNLLGLARFTEQAFVGDGSAIKTGQFGNVYGIPVYVTSNCPWIHVESTTTNTQLANFSGDTLAASTTAAWDGTNITIDFTAKTDTKWRVGAMVHMDAIALAEQQAVRTQTQYKQEYLADLFTADTVYGSGVLRDTSGVAFVVPAA